MGPTPSTTPLARCHTGCGKTEIARRLAKLVSAPFIKVRKGEETSGEKVSFCLVTQPGPIHNLTVWLPFFPLFIFIMPWHWFFIVTPPQVEATKYTELGYVGRDVEDIVKDLLEASIT